MQQHSMAKATRNSEESEDSSSEEGDQGSPDEKCFVNSNSRTFQNPPKENNHKKSIQEGISESGNEFILLFLTVS